MHTHPEVTVLMPVYNASLFIREAMESILSQSFTDFEFLIIDDGSTDDSVEIIRSYRDPRIRLYLNGQNAGISATLNQGLSLASCDLIARMDADDISYPDRLLKQHGYMSHHPECGLLSSWARVISSDGTFVKLERHRNEYYYYNLNFECWIYHPTVMFRRGVAERCGYYSKPYSEDYDLFWKIARESVIHNLDEPLLDYRLSPSSLNTVIRKNEYEAANRENVIRNLRYYGGEDLELPEACFECLRHNFGPILREQGFRTVLRCLDELDRLTEAIVKKPNVNCRPDDIRAAAFHKRTFIIEQAFLALRGWRKFAFILQTGTPHVLVWKIEKSLRWRFNYVKRHILSTNKP